MSNTDEKNITTMENLLEPIPPYDVYCNTHMESYLKNMKAPAPLSSWEELKEFINAHKLVLTGSFPLGIMSKSSYNVDNINFIYVKTHSGNNMYIQKFMDEKGWSYKRWSYKETRGTTYIFGKDGFNIDIAITSVYSYPQSYFDISMLAYDGHNWLLPRNSDNRAGSASYSTMGQCIWKNMRVNVPFPVTEDRCDLLKSMKKYQDRGFTITNLDEAAKALLANDKGQWNIVTHSTNAFWKSLFNYPQKGWLKLFCSYSYTWPFCGGYILQLNPKRQAVRDYFANDIKKNTERQYLREIYNDTEIDEMLGTSVVGVFPERWHGARANYIMTYVDMKNQWDPIELMYKVVEYTDNWGRMGTDKQVKYCGGKDKYNKDLNALYDKNPGIRLYRVVSGRKYYSATSEFEGICYEMERSMFESWFDKLSDCERQNFATIENSLKSEAFTAYCKSQPSDNSEVKNILGWYNMFVRSREEWGQKYNKPEPGTTTVSTAVSPTAPTVVLASVNPPEQVLFAAEISEADQPPNTTDNNEDDWSASVMVERSLAVLEAQEEAHNKSLKEIAMKIRETADTGARKFSCASHNFILTEKLIMALRSKGYEITDNELVSW